MFDLTTFLFCLGFFSFVMGVISFMSARTFPDVMGLRKWGVACFLFGMMWVGYSFWRPDLVPESQIYLLYLLTKILSSIAAIAACGFAVSALEDLFGVQPFPHTRPIIVASILGILVCSSLDPFNTYLVIPSTFGAGALLAIFAWSVFRHANFCGVPATWLALLSMALFSVILFGRGVYALAGLGDQVTIFTKTGIPFIGLAVGSLASLSIFISFLLLAHDKMRGMILETTRRDGLTSLYTRGAFFELANNALKSGTPCAFAMLDIDHFKRINDTYGHAAGDAALVYVARFINNCVRHLDVVGRYGGEEFCVMIRGDHPNNIEAFAARVVEQARKQAIRLPDSQTEIGFTFSVGYYRANPASGLTVAEMLNCADKALYEAKRSGRNRALSYFSLPDAIHTMPPVPAV
jgi:diguanylate cyclase (GGDEF)-like protein